MSLSIDEFRWLTEIKNRDQHRIDTKKKSTRSKSKNHCHTNTILDEHDLCVLDRETTCVKWTQLWSSFGFSDHQWNSRAAKVEDYTQKLFDNKVSFYNEQLRKRRTLLIQSLDEYDDLILRTGLHSAVDKTIFETLKLKEQELFIDKKMQDLLIEEGDLLQKTNDLEHNEQQLCAILNGTPTQFDENEAMSIVERNKKLEEHIQLLKDLKEHRQKEIAQVYSKLKEYSERLNWLPTTDTLKCVFDHDFERCLTADKLNEIQNTLNELEHQINKQKEQFHALRAQIDHLYRRLNKELNPDKFPVYKTNIDRVDASVIRQLEAEIDRCREERLKNGKEYCQTTRQQILNLLEKARLGQRDHAIVDQLDHEKLSADLLDAYDDEYERILTLYEKRKPVLDAYDKWLSFWNEFVAFTKASTDPARFRARGYNAQVEGRKRKKFLRELPQVEEEFLTFLSNCNEPTFLIGDTPIRDKFDQAHLEVPSSALPSNSVPRTMITVSASPRAALTPVQAHTLATTPARNIKTPLASSAKKLMNKVQLRTEKQPTRAKPKLAQATPTHPIVPLPVHPPASTDDQVLDFSLIHTVKNIHGQIKVMTSTPNSSLLAAVQVSKDRTKTANNPIERRKSKRKSMKPTSPILHTAQTPDETVPCVR